jgi:mRNA-degrading endonuclease RelE of RelBE toxin-antitoxin system
MPSYDLRIHRSARRELDNLTADQRDRLTSVLSDVSHVRKPTSHEKVAPLEGQDGLLRVRVGDVRAVVELQAPVLRVLRCGHRSTVYDAVDELDERRVSA